MRRHDPDYFSLAGGLLFTILGIVFVTAALTDWSLDGRWLAPIMLIALGIGGITASLAASRRQREQIEAVPVETADPTTGWTGDPFA